MDLPNEILEKIRELNFLSHFCSGKAKGEDALRISKLMLDIVFYDADLLDKDIRSTYGF